MKKHLWRAKFMCLMLSLLVVSGCVRIPTSGPVESVAQRSSGEDNSMVLQPRAPDPGASPQEIVEGFLAAMAVASGDYTSARTFLTEQEALDWQPGKQVWIYSDTQRVLSVTKDSVVLSAPLLGRLDQRGSFQHLENQTINHDFKLVQEKGEWRVSQAPDGLLMAPYLFDMTFTRATAYFWDPAYRTLVPDVFHVLRGKQTPTTLVQIVLAGPSDWLSKSVVSAVDQNVKLGTNSLPLSDDYVLEIPLSQEAAQIDGKQRNLLAWQIAATLAEQSFLDGTVISSIKFTVEHTPWTFPDSMQGIINLHNLKSRVPTELEVPPEVYAVSNHNKLVRVWESGDQNTSKSEAQSKTTESELTDLQPLPGELGQTIPGVQSLAVNTATTSVAYVTNGQHLYLGDLTSGKRSLRPIFSGVNILKPCYSRFEELWWISGAANDQKLYRLFNDKVEAIEAPALSGLSVESFAINPDGVHVAMVARKNNKLIAGIALLSRGNTTQLTDWKELSFNLSTSKPEDITDVAWQSDLRMVLLGKAESSTQVFAYFSELNSQTVTSGARPTEWMAKSVIASGYGPNNVVYILSFDGTVWRHVNGRTFTKYIEGVQSLALPGQ